MLQISKVEVWSLLNLLRELRDGSEIDDVEQELFDMIEMLEAILEKG